MILSSDLPKNSGGGTDVLLVRPYLMNKISDFLGGVVGCGDLRLLVQSPLAILAKFVVQLLANIARELI